MYISIKFSLLLLLVSTLLLLLLLLLYLNTLLLLFYATVNLDNEFVDSNTTNDHDEEYPKLKPGINLPKSNSEWLTANEYFKFTIPSNAPIRNGDLNSSISVLNNTIYNYFAENFGYVESFPDKSLKEKYENHNVKNLKKALKTLKSSNSNLAEIKHVSYLLRNKLDTNTVNKATNNAEALNHDNYIERNFWGYVKYMFHKKDIVLLTFTMTECLSYFKNVLASLCTDVNSPVINVCEQLQQTVYCHVSFISFFYNNFLLVRLFLRCNVRFYWLSCCDGRKY